MDPKARLFALAVASTAQQVSIDSAGRMLIPPNLRGLLGLERELRLFTAGAWVEIWNRTRYETQAYPQAAGIWDQLCGLDSLLSPAPAAAPREDA
jgi:DNA-binding transcriptional regulator/RsmH inhibitor MraZ